MELLHSLVTPADSLSSPFVIHFVIGTQEAVVVELGCLHVTKALRLNSAAILVEVDGWQHSIKGVEHRRHIQRIGTLRAIG